MSLYQEVFTAEFLNKLSQIQTLLTEAYEHYFANSDGVAKSSEGYISISLPSYFWSHGDRRPGVSIYSYALGPSRGHDFDNIDEALIAVRAWHRAEMSFVYEEGS